MNTLFPEDKSEVNTKPCLYCKQEKPLSEYYYNRSRHDRLDGRCKKCFHDRCNFVKKLAKTSPPPTEYCECCGKNNKDEIELKGHRPLKLSLDHDPITGKFRGWICQKCNGAIGQLGDTLESVMRAVEYLKRFEDSNNA
jgi:hypothetical protein